MPARLKHAYTAAPHSRHHFYVIDLAVCPGDERTGKADGGGEELDDEGAVGSDAFCIGHINRLPYEYGINNRNTLMASGIQVRWAVVDDAQAIAEIHVSSWRAAYRGIVPGTYLQSLSVEQRASRHREQIIENCKNMAVAQTEGHIVGFCTLGDSRDAGKSKEHTGEIVAIYLAPSHWRRGIGRRFIQWMEEQFRLRGKQEITLWVLEANAQSRNFYEAMGYRHDGANKVETIGAELMQVRYSKVISPG